MTGAAQRALIAAAVLAGGVGVVRRISDDVAVIAVPETVDRSKIEADRQTWLRQQEQERARTRQREIARMNAVAHGGEREARRRRRQIERGQLKAENGLAR